MGGMVEDVSDQNYEEFMQSPAAVVAYGIASCEPCTAYDPILAETASRFGDVRIGTVSNRVDGKRREKLAALKCFKPQPTRSGARVASRSQSMDSGHGRDSPTWTGA
jgi:hypothetical protein